MDASGNSASVVIGRLAALSRNPVACNQTSLPCRSMPNTAPPIRPAFTSPSSTSITRLSRSRETPTASGSPVASPAIGAGGSRLRAGNLAQEHECPHAADGSHVTAPRCASSVYILRPRLVRVARPAAQRRRAAAGRLAHYRPRGKSALRHAGRTGAWCIGNRRAHAWAALPSRPVPWRRGPGGLPCSTIAGEYLETGYNAHIVARIAGFLEPLSYCPDVKSAVQRLFRKTK